VKEPEFFVFRDSFHDDGRLTVLEFFLQSMGTRNLVGTELSYPPASLCSVAGRQDNPTVLLLDSWRPKNVLKFQHSRLSSHIYHLLLGCSYNNKREVVRNKMQSLAFHCM
jgi:hypothetical protein